MMTLSEIFKAAHLLTKKVVRHGDSYRATFGLALRKAFKSGKQALAERLTAAGRLWEKIGQRRVYFNDLADHLGLDVVRNQSGVIAEVWFERQPINVDEVRPAIEAMRSAKLWFDLDLLKWRSQGLTDDLRNAITARIEAAA